MIDNRKTRYTRRVIKESYYELLAEKPFDKITVKEICERADINKGSFYNHFENIYTLQAELENEAIENLKQILTEKNAESQDQRLQTLISSIYDNQEYYRLLFGMTQDSPFITNLIELLMDIVITNQQEEGADTISAEINTKYIMAVTYSVLKQWLKDGCTESRDSVFQVLKQIRPIIQNNF